ncbi:MAG TPA: hypothetical protein VFZ48_00605 [Candidatus Saccharimonadales bacterium]
MKATLPATKAELSSLPVRKGHAQDPFVGRVDFCSADAPLATECQFIVAMPERLVPGAPGPECPHHERTFMSWAHLHIGGDSVVYRRDVW